MALAWMMRSAEILLPRLLNIIFFTTESYTRSAVELFVKYATRSTFAAKLYRKHIMEWHTMVLNLPLHTSHLITGSLMDKFVCRYIMQCQRCQRFTTSHSLDFSTYAFMISDTFTHWNVDFAGPFPEDQFGFKYVCVAVEQISHWAEIRCSLVNTVAHAANFLSHDIICRFGILKSIHLDNGPQFVTKIIEELT